MANLMKSSLSSIMKTENFMVGVSRAALERVCSEVSVSLGTSGRAISPLALSSRRSWTATFAFSSGCSSSVCMSLTRVMICSI